MQGEVVDRTAHLGIGDRPFALEGGVAGPEGAPGGIEHLHHLPVETHEGVIADLVLITGMGGEKGGDGRFDPVHGFMQNHHPGCGVEAVAEGIALETLAIVRGIGADAALVEPQAGHALHQIPIHSRAEGGHGRSPR